MLWDIVLDPMRNLLSNNFSEWIVAAIIAAFVLTKLLTIFAESMEMRQEINVGVVIFLLLVGAFYLP